MNVKKLRTAMDNNRTQSRRITWIAAALLLSIAACSSRPASGPNSNPRANQPNLADGDYFEVYSEGVSLAFPKSDSRYAEVQRILAIAEQAGSYRTASLGGNKTAPDHRLDVFRVGKQDIKEFLGPVSHFSSGQKIQTPQFGLRALPASVDAELNEIWSSLRKVAVKEK